MAAVTSVMRAQQIIWPGSTRCCGRSVSRSPATRCSCCCCSAARLAAAGARWAAAAGPPGVGDERRRQARGAGLRPPRAAPERRPRDAGRDHRRRAGASPARPPRRSTTRCSPSRAWTTAGRRATSSACSPSSVATRATSSLPTGASSCSSPAALRRSGSVSTAGTEPWWSNAAAEETRTAAQRVATTGSPDQLGAGVAQLVERRGRRRGRHARGQVEQHPGREALRDGVQGGRAHAVVGRDADDVDGLDRRGRAASAPARRAAAGVRGALEARVRRRVLALGEPGVDRRRCRASGWNVDAVGADHAVRRPGVDEVGVRRRSARPGSMCQSRVADDARRTSGGAPARAR